MHCTSIAIHMGEGMRFSFLLFSLAVGLSLDLNTTASRDEITNNSITHSNADLRIDLDTNFRNKFQKLDLNQIDLLSPFQLMNKINNFCQLNHDNVVAILNKMKDKPSCVAYYVYYFEVSIAESRMKEQFAWDGFSLLKFFMDNGIKRGLSRSIFDPMYPVLHHPSRVFSWRTSLALLLPHPCAVPETWLINTLSFVLADKEILEWLDLYVVIGVDRNCSNPSVVVELFKTTFDRPEVTLVLTTFHNEILTTEKFDFLSLTAYRLNCQFFMTIHHTTVFMRPHVLWKGISFLINRYFLPNFEGFGYVFYHTSVATCRPGELIQECQYPVALFGRSHVELFVLPQNSPWQSLEVNGFDLMHAMAFYCEVYRAIKDSCGTFHGYLTFNPDHTLPLPSNPEQLLKFGTIFQDLPFMIFRHRLAAASWLASSSTFPFRYTTRSMVYTDGLFSNYFQVNPEDTRDQCHNHEPSAQPDPYARVAFITSIYGGYESTVKPFARQTIPADFFCFTDFSESMPSNGWIIDRTPYHQTIPLPYDSPNNVNSFTLNSHPFNICKFYKTAFHLIPRLQKYDLVVWLDGTVVITNSTVAETLLRLAESGEASLSAIEHWRGGSLFKEADASNYSKYNSEFFAGYQQPIQDVMGQYNDYLELGYDENLWKRIQPTRPQYGLWITCFVGFYMKDPRVPRFLSMWHEHILKYSTQDQVSFSFVAQFTGLYPYSFPDVNHGAEGVDQMTSWFFKHWHGA